MLHQCFEYSFSVSALVWCICNLQPTCNFKRLGIFVLTYAGTLLHPTLEPGFGVLQMLLPLHDGA